MLKELKALEKNVGNFRDMGLRIHERETSLYRLGY